MKEQQYQKKIVTYLEQQGAYVVKVVAASKKGVPDILACYRGYFLAIEVKTPTTRANVSKLQDYNLNKVSKAGGISGVAVHPDDLFKLMLDIDLKATND